MSNYKLSLMEQETIILYNQGEKDAEIYTHDPTLIKKMKEHPEIARLKSINEFSGYTFVVPKKEIYVGFKRHYSGKARESMLKNLEKAKMTAVKRGVDGKYTANRADTQ